MILAFEKFPLRPAIKLIVPKEHGSWSLALEPVALGLLVAPSAAGLALAGAGVAGFLLRRPLKTFCRETDQDRRETALGGMVILAALALAGLALAVRIGGLEKLWALVPATSAGLAFAWFDSRNEGREGAAEVASAVAFGLLPAALASLAGWNSTAALSLAAIMLARSVPTVLFVRTFLRIRKGRATTLAPAMAAAAAGLGLVAGLAVLKDLPWLGVIFMLAMAARTVLVLTVRPNLSARALGVAEAIFGAVMVLTLAAVWRIA